MRACCRHYPGAAPGRPACSLVQSYQPSPEWQSGRPAHRLFRGLLGVHSRYGLHTRAVTVIRDPLHRRLQPFRYLHSCSGCFRLERLPGGAYTHWESAAFSRHTPEAGHSPRTLLWSSPRSPQARREQLFPRSRHIQRDDRFCRPEQVAQAMSNLRLGNRSHASYRWMVELERPVNSMTSSRRINFMIDSRSSAWCTRPIVST